MKTGEWMIEKRANEGLDLTVQVNNEGEQVRGWMKEERARTTRIRERGEDDSINENDGATGRRGEWVSGGEEGFEWGWEGRKRSGKNDRGERTKQENEGGDRGLRERENEAGGTTAVDRRKRSKVGNGGKHEEDNEGENEGSFHDGANCRNCELTSYLSSSSL
jgi:hypothetical protein